MTRWSRRRPPGGSSQQAWPPGHFYSPIPDLGDIRARSQAIFDRRKTTLPGIDLHPVEQLSLLDSFASMYRVQPFTDQPGDHTRYGFDNEFFSYGDGLALYCMLRRLAPARVIEVGSGWSSALMLDTDELFLSSSTQFTFIEPEPERLNALLRSQDSSCTVIAKPLHSVSDDVFADLRDGDLLFIDSTHVSKVGSDVNRLLLDVVPALPAGVMVHIHDVFWPFEYPEAWVYEGRSWTEDYLLRALLVGNRHLRVTWFNAYLGQLHHNRVAAAMPLWSRNTGGSIYLTVE